MAKINQSKSPAKGLVAGFITAGLITLAYAAIFPLHRIGDYLIVAALALLGGRIAYIMGSGLDTSKKPGDLEQTRLTGDEAADKLILRGREMLAAIRQENEKIPDAQLSAKIEEIEAVAVRIFRTVADQPQKAPQIRRFMEYYLPTTLKMLGSYRKMDERGVAGQNANTTRERIRSAMDVVVDAFKKQLDTLYQNDMLDISTDIDVLETMLKQDSLIGRDFKTSAASAGAQAQAQKEE